MRIKLVTRKFNHFQSISGSALDLEVSVGRVSVIEYKFKRKTK
jgi:hypothetical protein